jgi:hypothetical protein
MEKAILAEDLEEIKALLEEGYDPNGKTETNTPYIFITENIKILELLISYGADTKARDENGFILEDYTDDAKIILLLNNEKNTIIVKPSKFIKYRGTLRGKQNRATTRRRAKQSDLSL